MSKCVRLQAVYSSPSDHLNRWPIIRGWYGVENGYFDIALLLTGNPAGNDNADVNADGRITIDDVTALINLLLTGR